MKKYFYLVFASLPVLFTSCEEFLTVPKESESAETVVYVDPDVVEKTVFAIYNMYGENNSYRNRLFIGHGGNTDTERNNSSDSVASTVKETAICCYNVTSGFQNNYNDADNKNPYGRIYTAIERANLTIDGIRRFHGNTPENAKMAYLLGEALTLRANFYYDLTKWWGDVPARFEPITAATLYLAKTNRDVIYTQILADLATAENLVDWSGVGSTPSTVVRVNKAAVKALRARIALAAAGYSMRPKGTAGDVKYSGINADIVRTASASYRQELYEIARQETYDIIAKYGSTKLTPSFEDVFKNQVCKQVINFNSVESLFEIAARNQMAYYWGLRHAGDANGGTLWSTKKTGLFYMTPTLFYDYAPGDLRRDVTGVPYYWMSEGSGVSKVTKQKETKVTEIWLAKYRPEWMNTVVTSNDVEVNVPVIRYADVLLMYAESCVELGSDLSGLSSEECFNMVRRRAFGKPIDTPDATVDKTSLTLNDIINERAFEFTGEQIRKYDLIRWGLLKDKMDEAKEKLKRLADKTGEYADVPTILYLQESPLTNGYKTLTFYGLNRGETDDKTISDPGNWTKFEKFFAEAAGAYIKETYIRAFYFNNPNERQLLPIMDVDISGSQGKLVNDYAY